LLSIQELPAHIPQGPVADLMMPIAKLPQSNWKVLLYY
jgi:hypothetical protein